MYSITFFDIRVSTRLGDVPSQIMPNVSLQ